MKTEIGRSLRKGRETFTALRAYHSIYNKENNESMNFFPCAMQGPYTASSHHPGDTRRSGVSLARDIGRQYNRP